MLFNYKAINNDGSVVTGTATGETLRGVARSLRQQGLTVTALEPGRTHRHNRLSLFQRSKPTNRETVIFIHQLAVLLKSGMPIDEAVESLAESVENLVLADQCGKLGRSLRRGASFAESFRESGVRVPGYFYPLCEAAELTGNLAGALRDGITQWEYELKTRKEMISSLTYPAILVVSGIASVGIIFLLVVPKFSKMLDNSKVDLPFLAKLVLGTGKFVNEHLFLLLGSAGAVVAACMVFFMNPESRKKGWDFLATLPLVGSWITEADIGRWAAMLATLLENRVELIYAMDLAQRGVTLTRLKSSFVYASRAVSEGADLSQALSNREMLTSTAINLVRVGENSGELPGMLRALAHLYDDSVKTRMQRFLSLIEPIAILLIGGVVGVIMAGIILAITSVNQISL